jgi:hypothetical protein
MSVGLPAGIEAQFAQTQLNVGLANIKANAEADKAIANILEQAVENVPTSSFRGTNLNTTA